MSILQVLRAAIKDDPRGICLPVWHAHEIRARLRGGSLKIRVRQDGNSEGDVDGLEPLPLGDGMLQMEREDQHKGSADADDICEEAAEVRTALLSQFLPGF
jgi:hypothetical protein